MMRTARMVLFGAVIGCGPGLGDGPSSGSSEGSATTAGTGGTTTGPGPTTGATVGTSVGSTIADTGDVTTAACNPEDEAGDEVHFDIGPALECEIFGQNCREGEKCVPEGFYSRICVPVVDDPIPDGEACVDTPGEDACGPTSWCGLVEGGEGTCVPMCGGTFDEPVCPPDTICVIDDEGIVAFCQRPCDPFVPDSCPADACQATPHGFGCVPDGTAGPGEHCYEDDSCMDGMVCRHHSFVADCCHFRCCVPLCDAEHPCESGTCLFDPAVLGAEDVGFCG